MSTKKLSRHDIKKPDEFIVTVSKGLDWIRARSSAVAMIIGALVIISLVTFALMQRSQSKNAEAQYKYGQASDALYEALEKTGPEREKEIRAALEKLQAVYDANPDSRSGAFSLQSIGHAQFELRNYEQAANIFEKAAAAFEKEPNFKAMALVGVGKSYEAMRSYKKALDAFQRASGVTGNPYGEVLKTDMGRIKQYVDRAAEFDAARRAAQASTLPTGQQGLKLP